MKKWLKIASLITLLTMFGAGFLSAAYLVQNSFTSGEITPRMVGRSDISKYQSGLDTLTNAIVLPHGGVSRRPGFKYIAEVKTSSKATRLVSFEFSTTQAYIIEFGDQYCRFYMDGGQIMDGASAYEIATPYRDEDVSTLKFAQSADVLFISHPNYSPRKLSRTAHTTWTLTEISFTARPSDWALASIVITGATAANPVVITSVGHGLASANQVVISGVVGMTELNGNLYDITVIDPDTFSLQDPTTGANVNGSTYTAYDSAGTVDVVGQPACVTLFEDRSVWAGVSSYPQSIYMSKAGDFEDMTTGTADDDALEITISSDQVNVIRWLVSGKKLLIGTNGGEWWASGSGTDEPITPSSITIRRETSYGSENVQPLSIGSNVIFIQRPGKVLRQWSYVFESDAYSGTDRSVFSEHLTKNYGITDLAYQQSPNSIVWAIRSDGALLSLTYMPEHEVYGWARHTTGTTDDFESIAVIPGDAFDELWAIVSRTINSTTVRYVEQLQSNEWAYNFENTVVSSSGTPALETNPNTSLLIHSNTTDGSQTFVDSGPIGHTIPMAGYPVGNAHHETDQKKFGATSIHFDGTGDNIVIEDHAGFAFTDGNFTVEFWIYSSANNPIMGLWDISGNSRSWLITRVSASRTINFQYSTLGTGASVVTLTGTVAMNANAWNHVRIVRSGAYIRTFINGKLDQDYNAGTDSFYNPNNAAINYGISYYNGIAGASYFEGYLDEILIVKGEALSTGDFIPPTVAYGSTAVAASETTETATTPENAFFVDSGLIYDGNAATITGATRADPVVITATSHGFTNGQTVFIYGVVGMTELNGNFYKVADKTDHTFELTDPDDDADIDGTGFIPYSSGGTAELKATTISGLDHLEGKTVAVLADGAVQGTKTVQGGSITLDSGASKAIIGIPYTTDIKTLRPDLGQKETLLGRNKRINNVILELYETFSCKAGPDAAHLDDVRFDNTEYPRGTMPGLFTGQKRIRTTSAYNYDGQILIRQTDPAPLTLLAIIKDIEVY